jgi:serine/threonine-protein kinase
MLSVGQLLQGRYHITELLGHGGMGAVFGAYDSRLNKVCVVKEMLATPELAADPAAAAEQFKREAQVLAATTSWMAATTIWSWTLSRDRACIV